MSISMFVTGFVIFSCYLAVMIWNINNGHKIDEKERRFDHGTDDIDADGMGDFSRFPNRLDD